MKEYMKDYHTINKEKMCGHSKEYYERNKDKKNEKISCECGCDINKQNLKQHQKTKNISS